MSRAFTNKKILPAVPRCYCLAVFTRRLRENVEFYTRIFEGKIISERPDRYCDLQLGGLPLSFHACGEEEPESHFHLYFTILHEQRLLERLQHHGVIVRRSGPYVTLLDPDGRVIKISSEKAIVG